MMAASSNNTQEMLMFDLIRQAVAWWLFSTCGVGILITIVWIKELILFMVGG
jgi:hypothetical protein